MHPINRTKNSNDASCIKQENAKQKQGFEKKKKKKGIETRNLKTKLIQVIDTHGFTVLWLTRWLVRVLEAGS